MTLGGIKIHRSDAVQRGTMLVLGGPPKPENWRSMTRDEQVRWAIVNGSSIAIHPLDRLLEEKS